MRVRLLVDCAKPTGTRMRHVFVPLLLLSLLAAPAVAGDDVESLRKALHELIVSGDYATALRRADVALESDGDSALAMQYRAYALHQMGRTDEARRAYERTVELAPENWWAHMNLGSLLASLGRWDKALEAATRATALKPDSGDAWARVVRIHRDRLANAKAKQAVGLALSKGIDAGWCHAQLADLAWIANDRDSAREHWARAEKLGFDADAVVQGLRLVAWDEQIRRPEPLAPSVDWVFKIGKIEVRTRVGPKLPREIQLLIGQIQRDQERLLGVRGKWPFEVRLILSRTVEEHEIHRRREYSQGHRGGAFHLDNRWRRRSWRGPRAAPRSGRFDIYVPWSVPGLERRLSHEILHSVIRMRIPEATDLPMWLDEGLATYVELSPDKHNRLRPGTVRLDLLESLAVAHAAGELPHLDRFLRVQYREFHGKSTRAYYAKSWALVHFLLGRTGGRRQLERYLEALNNPSARSMRAFTKVYGADLGALENAWWKHVLDIIPD
jgi:tetratricopeptide (TPR) repeat protein